LPKAGKAGLSSGEWPQIGHGETLTERVYQVLRDRIVAGELPPLSFIREEELGKAVGVSRTPVREALNRLATEGFLDRLPHRGFRVPERSIDDLVHLYPVLQSLEVLAAELACPRMTAVELARLEEINRGFARALEASDVATGVELNHKFHHELSALSGNPFLVNLLDDIRAQVRRLEVLDFTWVLTGPHPEADFPRDRWPAQHAAIIAALGRRDCAEACRLLRTNRSLVFQTKLERVREFAGATRVGSGDSRS
jgi:DNA-binding GntR family transcriptional regulator